MKTGQPARHVERPDVLVDVVGRTAAPGVTWVWARSDIDLAGASNAGTALSELAGLLTGDPRRILVYVGADRVVDQYGARLLHHLAVTIRRRGGDLAVVAPPPSLRRAVLELGLASELPMFESVGHAVSWARTQARPATHQEHAANGSGMPR
jgi:anti-anti-sigma regulatory factor